jgi:AraC family transcriptional regulator of adaptative response / DNA-3-methyladenine glycosylase II
VILPDSDTCYRAVKGRDARFDGWFYTAVRTTGIYCRPSCPARTPKRENVEFHPSAAAAQRSGFRACKRCRPDAAPGSPAWDVRGDLAGRALRLIGDGVIDREGVPGLARRLAYSERQLNRTLVAEVGAGPLALARSQRAQTARVLLETSDLPSGDVAFAAGFASIRQFNETMQEVFAATPTQLRAGRRNHVTTVTGVLDLRLPYRTPMSLARTFEFLATRAIPGVESFDGGVFTRTLVLPNGPALVQLSDGGDHVRCRVRLADQRDLVAAVSRVRRLLDLDADPVAIDEALRTDAQLLPLVDSRPGLRSPGSVDGFEMALRAIVGQQISVAGARTLLGRIAVGHGRPVFQDEPWWSFPEPAALAGLAPEDLPMPRTRGRTVLAVAQAMAAGDLKLDVGADRAAGRAALLALPGIGPWTADYLRMRAMADPDVLLETDLGIRHAARSRDIELATSSAHWAPWRSYANHHLWAAHLSPARDRTFTTTIRS